MEHIQIVLQILRNHMLYIKFSMCEFLLEFMTFLGHMVSKEGIMVNLAKIEVIRGSSMPTLV